MIFLTGCEKHLLMTDIEPDPLMVVNGIQQVGQPACLVVEKSSFYLGAQKDLRVKDLTADLYVNGEFKESLQVMDSGLYQSYIDWETGEEVLEQRYAFTCCQGTYLLQEGDRLRFELSAPEFEKTVEAECTLPFAPNVVSFDTVHVEHDSGDESLVAYTFALTLDDPVGPNYYSLYPQGSLESFASSDPVFSDFAEVVDIEGLFGESDFIGSGPYNMFNDLYFDGKRYSLELKMYYWLMSEDIEEPFTVEVTCVDAGFYQYMKSYNSYDYVEGGVLEYVTEPAQVYSNVKNGVGIVAGQSRPVTMSVQVR